MSNVSNVLTELHERYQRMYTDAGLLPRTDYIKEWDSPCYSGSVEGEEVAWQPIVQQPPLDFSNVEDALALTIHKDLKDFFAGFWAGDLQVRFRDLSFTLLQVQSQQDAERLQQNLIGHVLMKQRLKHICEAGWRHNRLTYRTEERCRSLTSATKRLIACRIF